MKDAKQLLGLVEAKEPALIDELKGEAPEMIRMFTSKAYSLWAKYADAMLEALKDNAISADTIQDREDARSQYMALQRWRQIPSVLLDMARALNSEPEPGDSPQPTGIEGAASQEPAQPQE